MRVLSAEEIAKWFQQYENLGVRSDYVHADKDGLFFTNSEAACIDVEYPPKLERLPYFARCLATIGYEEKDFQGALFWVSSWGVWNSNEETIGYRIVEQMNASVGQPKSFEVAPGHRFRPDELLETIGMLLQPMIFAWDCYYHPTWSYGTDEFFLHVSHHSHVSVVTRTKAFNERVFEQLDKLNFNPKPSSEKRTSRFCRP